MATCKKDMFFFPAKHYIAHPAVRFVYKTNRDFSTGSIDPDYVCFDVIVCKDHHWPIVTILNETCSAWNKFLHLLPYSTYTYTWDDLIFSVRQIFAACFLSDKKTAHNDLLFNCSQSFFISKHRLNDGYKDCLYYNDEVEQRNVCALNLANRFQCKTGKKECIPRLLLSDSIKDCTDGSDENAFYICTVGIFEAGCKWKRGSLEATASFAFYRLCDGFVDFSEDNATDEESCHSSWIHNCNSSLTRCDGQWHCRDGHDELHCPLNPFNPCKNNQQFYCVNKTNGQFVCYSPDLAGDGHEDCVGALDERVGGYCHLT